MPHRILAFLICLFFVFSVTGQPKKGKSEPLNAEFNHCLPHQAKYKREVYQLTDGRWKTVDRYLNGIIQGEAYYLNRALTEKTDTARTYYMNGQVESEKVYFNNTRNGVWKWFTAAGDLIVQGQYFDNKPYTSWKWYGPYADYYQPSDTLNLDSLVPNRRFPETASKKSAFEKLNSSDYPMHDAIDGLFGFNFVCFKVDELGNTSEIKIAIHGTSGMDEYILYYANRFPKFRPEPKKNCYCLPITFMARVEQNVIHDQEVMSYQELSHQLFKFALKEMGSLDFDMAKAALHWAIYYYAQDPGYYHNLAVCYEKLGDRRNACAYFEMTHLLNPDFVSQQIKEACEID